MFIKTATCEGPNELFLQIPVLSWMLGNCVSSRLLIWSFHQIWLCTLTCCTFLAWDQGPGNFGWALLLSMAGQSDLTACYIEWLRNVGSVLSRDLLGQVHPLIHWPTWEAYFVVSLIFIAWHSFSSVYLITSFPATSLVDSCPRWHSVGGSTCLCVALNSVTLYSSLTCRPADAKLPCKASSDTIWRALFHWILNSSLAVFGYWYLPLSLYSASYNTLHSSFSGCSTLTFAKAPTSHDCLFVSSMLISLHNGKVATHK